eukprot:5419574-Pyramimonas_sp.AAC.1
MGGALSRWRTKGSQVVNPKTSSGAWFGRCTRDVEVYQNNLLPSTPSPGPSPDEKKSRFSEKDSKVKRTSRERTGEST